MYTNIKIAGATFLAVLCSILAFAQNFPEQSNRLVTDYTGTLTSAEADTLENKLVTFNDSTSSQIAVVIIDTLGGYDVADYASKLAEKWGVGRSGKNNGILVLVAIKDRKMTIQTGYGMEGALPDAIALRIIENDLKPAFKRGQYYAGLDKATDSIIAYTKGEYKNDEVSETNPWLPLLWFGGFVAILTLIFLCVGSAVSPGSGSSTNYVFTSSGTTSSSTSYSRPTRASSSSSSSPKKFSGFGGGKFGGGGASGSW